MQTKKTRDIDAKNIKVSVECFENIPSYKNVSLSSCKDVSVNLTRLTAAEIAKYTMKRDEISIGGDIKSKCEEKPRRHNLSSNPENIIEPSQNETVSIIECKLDTTKIQETTVTPIALSKTEKRQNDGNPEGFEHRSKKKKCTNVNEWALDVKSKETAIATIGFKPNV